MNGTGGEAALVSCAISRRGKLWTPGPGGKSAHFAAEQFEVQRQSVRIVRPAKAFPSPVKSQRGEIDSFSAKSQRRLRLAAANADPALISMFVATYAESWPKDGKEAKKQLDCLLQRIRRRLPGCSYLWVLEFQGRGAPHFHVFLSEPVTPELHRFLADAWTEIAAPGCEKHSKVHRHAKAFIPWDMGTGVYVAKYLDKAAQKDVPDEFLNVGRFWGASRGLVPPPLRVIAEEMSAALFKSAPKAVTQALRWLGKWHERHTGGRSLARKKSCSYMIPTGATAFKQICRYLMSRPILSASTWWDEFEGGQPC